MATIFMPIDICGYAVGASQPSPTVIFATGQASNGLLGLSFNDTTRQDAYYEMPALQYGSGNLTLDILWFSIGSSTTGAVVWGSRIYAITAGDAVAVDGKSFATAATVTTTVNATARGLTRSTITISSLDSLAALDSLHIDVYRDASNGSDTMTGDATVLDMWLSYSDT